MEPQIIINGKQVRIGEPLPEKITVLSVTFQQGFLRMAVPKQQEALIKQWFNSLIDKLDCEYITYNNIITRAEDLRRFDEV